MKRAVTITGIVAAALLEMCSCQREPIYDGRSEYRIEITPEYDMLYNTPDKDPNLYRVLFYDPLSHKLVTSNTVGTKGGYLYNITPGVYDIVVYNYTMNKTKVSHEENLNSLMALTTVLSYQDLPVVETPDHLLVAKMEDVVIPHLTVNDSEFVLKVTPKSIVDSWCLVINGIKGLRNVNYIDTYITGQAQAVYLDKGKGGISDVNVTIFFPAVCDLGRGIIYTPFNTFGKIEDKVSDLRLNIRIVGSGGDEYVCEADVSDQFEDPDNVNHIITATFDVTVKERKNGGMSPVADDWNPEIEEISLR